MRIINAHNANNSPEQLGSVVNVTWINCVIHSAEGNQWIVNDQLLPNMKHEALVCILKLIFIKK